MNKPLWTPDEGRIRQSNLYAFQATVNARYGLELGDYWDLHAWSVRCPEQFWCAVWDQCGVIAQTRGDIVLANGDAMPGASFFPDARLNFAENLLRRRDGKLAFVFRGEDQVERSMTYQQLYELVRGMAEALRTRGVGKGDRVGGYLPNMPETIAAMLATVSLGATWSSCSPDFGVQGVVDRFGQIEPKVMFCADGYFYNGKTIDSLDKAAGIQAAVPSITDIIVVPYTRSSPDLSALRNGVMLADALGSRPGGDIQFEQMPFNHPLYIMYSSGTTGVPKCIVHGAGGTLLKHLEEHQLQTDVKEDDKLFYFTTCGWMMWNWLASGLACGATLLLYDGSPFYPGPRVLFDFADHYGMTIFGTSAKYIDAVKKSGFKPAASHDLSTLKTMLSTGSPLVPESFDFVYQHIKSDLHLASIAGGTDIVGCFVLGIPTLPVWRGEIQGPALGMDSVVFDDDGLPVVGQKGELVCRRSFPSMPVGFWDDADNVRYKAAYFERFAGVWCHGDYVEQSGRGGMVIHGRSDAVLNPGGVRIGTAEIYRQVEQLDEVVEGLVVGQQWEGDVRVVLFVRLSGSVALDEALETRIRKQIRDNATPRHVPARIVQVADIPRTKSGKIVELAVRNIVHGEPVKNMEALANPEALDLFADLSELRS
ncbi:MAG: acetoacetate--CoA ligase [Chromatiales bacterium]|jgi:acetoacetyl-CoA synthetase|nr:acetoacetate--CoA ligase [Chromatiales bacterium]